MTQQNPITPPPELRALWRHKAPRYRDGGVGREDWLIDSAAQWCAEQANADIERKLQEAADQELEACRQWLEINGAPCKFIDGLLVARRPKPPSLKRRALIHFDSYAGAFNTAGGDSDLIFEALESIPDPS